MVVLRYVQACQCYESALAIKPTAHAALYNWGVALSDLARCIKASQPKEATAALYTASQKYAQSLQLHPRNPQALNNWGLVLQVGRACAVCVCAEQLSGGELCV